MADSGGGDPEVAGEWFAAAGSSYQPGADFVAALKAAAARWSFDGLSPQATELDGLTAQIAVPGLTCAVRYLRVAYDPSGNDPTLRGEWANEYVFDALSATDFDLVVNGVDASPAQYGHWAADWLRRQLSRPIMRQEWDEQPHSILVRGDSSVRRVSSRRWVFDDTNDTLDEDGSWFGRWLFKRPPDRVLTEWAGATA